MSIKKLSRFELLCMIFSFPIMAVVMLIAIPYIGVKLWLDWLDEY